MYQKMLDLNLNYSLFRNSSSSITVLFTSNSKTKLQFSNLLFLVTYPHTKTNASLYLKVFESLKIFFFFHLSKYFPTETVVLNSNIFLFCNFRRNLAKKKKNKFTVIIFE